MPDCLYACGITSPLVWDFVKQLFNPPLVRESGWPDDRFFSRGRKPCALASELLLAIAAISLLALARLAEDLHKKRVRSEFHVGSCQDSMKPNGNMACILSIVSLHAPMEVKATNKQTSRSKNEQVHESRTRQVKS